MTFQWPEQPVIDNALNLEKSSIPSNCQYVDIVQANVSAFIKLLARVVQEQDTVIYGPYLYHRPGSTSLFSLRQCHPTLASTQPLSSLGNEVLLLRGHTLSPSLSAEE